MWACDAGHSFDVARAGYVNLLQPQDRRSPLAGDPTSAIEARRRLLSAGVGAGLFASVAAMVGALPLGEDRAIVELGCGSGEFLGQFLRVGPAALVGLDLSAAAITMAARAFPDLTWAVANADRRLPLLDGSVDVVVSVHSRRNPAECARVLKSQAWLIVTVPAPDDLIELREMVLGQRVEQDRATAVVAAHATGFTLASQTTFSEQVVLSAGQLDDLLTGTYRGVRHGASSRRASLQPMTVTMAADVLMFRRK